MAYDSERGDGTLSGTVKWFDPVKGFGFVVSDDEENDILLHANVLRNFGQSSVTDGAQIELVFQHTNRGVQALKVLSIEPVASDEINQTSDLGISYDDLLNVPIVAARIKWFDKSKGFGFANAFGSAEDIFIHIDVLRRSGLADLAPGEAVALRIVDGERGKMAGMVNAWESAVNKDDF